MSIQLSLEIEEAYKNFLSAHDPFVYLKGSKICVLAPMRFFFP